MSSFPTNGPKRGFIALSGPFSENAPSWKTGIFYHANANINFIFQYNRCILTEHPFEHRIRVRENRI